MMGSSRETWILQCRAVAVTQDKDSLVGSMTKKLCRSSLYNQSVHNLLIDYWLSLMPCWLVSKVVIYSACDIKLSSHKMRIPVTLDRSLIISWRKSLNLEKVVLCIQLCVCICICKHATGHTFWLRNPIFWLYDPWNPFFSILSFTLFWHSSIFPLCITLD